MFNDTVLECPDFSDADSEFLDRFSFWVEGVLLITMAVFGIVGNSIASVIISRKEMRNSFNLLLVSLACFDSTYLFGSILESFRKNFNLASRWHIILFPHLLYPFHQMAISGSIFMTVAIAWERYFAVHYPLDYNQAMNDTNAMRKRVIKYVCPVFVLAFAFNVVKFFEADIVYEAIMEEWDNGTLRVIGYEPRLQVAELRTHPAYSAYNNWSRLLILGIIPFLLLVFFNTKIYRDIVERRRRRMRTHRLPRASDSNIMTEFISLPPVNTPGTPNSPSFIRRLSNRRKSQETVDKSESSSSKGSASSRAKRFRLNFGRRLSPSSLKMSKVNGHGPAEMEMKCLSQQNSLEKGHGHQQSNGNFRVNNKSPSISVSNVEQLNPPKNMGKTLETNLDDLEDSPQMAALPSTTNSSTTSSNSTRRTVTISAPPDKPASGRGSSAGSHQQLLNVPPELSCMPGASILLGSPSGSDEDDDDDEGATCKIPDNGYLAPLAPLCATASPTTSLLHADPHRLRRRQVQTNNERRRRFEDNLAAIFMGFGLVFLVCHFPRLLLNIHEVFTIKAAVKCMEMDKQAFPLWSLILISISHFLLVLNSSINILIYCLLSSKFREECAILIRRLSRRHAAPSNNNLVI